MICDKHHAAYEEECDASDEESPCPICNLELRITELEGQLAAACLTTPTINTACPCCARAGEYNGYGSDGPTTFTCPAHCSCHD